MFEFKNAELLYMERAIYIYTVPFAHFIYTLILGRQCFLSDAVIDRVALCKLAAQLYNQR